MRLLLFSNCQLAMLVAYMLTSLSLIGDMMTLILNTDVKIFIGALIVAFVLITDMLTFVLAAGPI